MQPATRHAGRSGTAAWAALLVLLAGLVRLPSFPAPVARDAGQLLYGGMVILHGGTPYVDAAVNKGPLAYPVFAVVRLVVGRSELGLRVLLLVASIVATGCLWAFAHRSADRWTGRLTGLSFALLSATAVFQGADPNVEQFAVAPMALALLTATVDTSIAAALAGALTAGVALLSPDLLIATGPCVGLVLGRRPVRRFARLGLAAAGAAVVALGVAVWLGAAGALGDFFALIPGTSGRPAQLGLGELVRVHAGGLWLIAIGSALAALTRPQLRFLGGVALTWIALCWARTYIGDPLAGDRLFPQHDYPAVVGIALALGSGARSLRPRSRIRLAVGITALAAVVVVYVALPEGISFQAPVALRGVGRGAWARAVPLAAFVDAHTAPSQRIFVTGSDPEIYWLADRLSPTRFADDFPIRAHPAYARERDAELRRSPPAAIVTLDPATPAPDVAAFRRREGYRLAYHEPAGEVWLRPRVPTRHGPSTAVG